jgi:hypothetical protein
MTSETSAVRKPTLTPVPVPEGTPCFVNCETEALRSISQFVNGLTRLVRCCLRSHTSDDRGRPAVRGELALPLDLFPECGIGEGGAGACSQAQCALGGLGLAPPESLFPIRAAAQLLQPAGAE